MRTTSALYQQLRSTPGSFYNVRVVVTGGNTYGVDKLRSCKIMNNLTGGSGISVGGTCSAQCDLYLRESTANWPRMAEFSVQVQLSSADGLTTSEWLNMGTFYTDERTQDRSGNLSITGFDAMLKTEASWSDKIPSQDMPANWPITASDAADLVEEATGIALDSRNNLDDTVAYIGLDTTTSARDMLSYIAAGVGGNWQITPDGKLLLVHFYNVPDDPSAIRVYVAPDEWTKGTIGSSGGANASSSYCIRTNNYYPVTPGQRLTFVGVKSENGVARLVRVFWYNSSKTFLSYNSLSDTTRTVPSDARYVRFVYGWVSSTGQTVDAYGKDKLAAGWALKTESDDYAFEEIGLSARSIQVGADFPSVTGVVLESEDGLTSSAGSTSGYVVKGSCNFANSASVAALCLTELNGKTYRPFSASGAIIDPADEIGDLVILDNGVYQLGKIEWSFGTMITANIGAPFEAEVDHEYQVETSQARAMLKAVQAAELASTYQSAIQQNASMISVVVEEVQGRYVVNTASIVTAINQSGSSIEINADKIQMTGTTTFLTAYDVGSNGTTVIDGDRIATGSIDADKLNVGSITAGAIASGTVYISENDYYGPVGSIYSSRDQYGYANALRISSEGSFSINSGGEELQAFSLSLQSDYGIVYITSGFGLIRCQGTVYPSSSGSYNLGTADERWGTIYGYTSNFVNSDRNLKKDIEDLPAEYEALFDNLRPVRFRYRDGKRFHTGMISQEVEKSIFDVGLTDMDFAGFGKDETKNGTVYSLRYEEFISLCIDQIQKLKARVAALEGGKA